MSEPERIVPIGDRQEKLIARMEKRIIEQIRILDQARDEYALILQDIGYLKVQLLIDKQLDKANESKAT